MNNGDALDRGLATSLIGRDDALASLREALAHAENRRGRLVLVSGEPGIGKSALVEALAAEAAARGDEVVQGRAWELGEAPPYFPVWAPLRALGVAPPTGAVAEGDTFFLWERVLEALGRKERTVVWVLEDLHAADAATLDLLVYLARPLRALRFLLIVTLRDRDPRLLERTAARLLRLARDGQELRLGPLMGDDLKRLIAGIVGRGVSPALFTELCEVSGGNPLFAIECARAARDAGSVTQGERLPATLRTLITERVAGLGSAARDLLACGAILGREFRAATVARMKSALPAQVIEPLQAALRAGLLLEAQPGQFRFSHILVRDAIEADLSAGQRVSLHDLALRALEGEGAPGMDVLVEKARHALLALRPDGVALAEGAAARLLELGAPDRALALFQRLEEAAASGLLAGRATGDAALRRAAVFRVAGRYAECKRRCLAVIDEARAVGDGALLGRAALELGAEIRAASIDPDLVAALREALALLNENEPALRCRLEARLAGALQPAKDPEVPMQMARAAIASARAHGDPALLLEVLHSAGSALVDFAPLPERRALGVEFAALAASQGDPARALVAHARLALDTAEAGAFDMFADHVAHARQLSLQLGHPRRRWRALMLESMLALARGDVETSERCVVEVQQLADLTDDPGLANALPAHVFYRDILLHRDERVSESLPGLSAVLSGVPFGEPILSAVAMGAYARFEAVALTQAPWSRASRVPPFAELRLMVAEAGALIGSDEERRTLLKGLMPLSDAHVVSGHVPITYEGPVARVIALLEASLGERDAAVVRLEAALKPLRAAGFRTWVAQLSYDLGRICGDNHQVAESRTALAESLRLAEEIGMPGLVKRARARLNHLDAAPPIASSEALTPVTVGGSPVSQSPFSLVREVDVWRIEHRGKVIRVRHSRGVELLARLIERPGEEVHVLTLASDGAGVLVEGDIGEGLDTQALSAYRDRLAEIDAALDLNEASGDMGRIDRLRSEREAIETELSRSVGLFGRGRPNASASERARVNVQRRLKEATGRIKDADAELGAHLQSALHTGTFCCYRP